MANNARTQALLASQWRELEKGILADADRSAREALYDRVKGMIEEYRDFTSYERRTGNMDASVIGAIYNKGKILQLARYTNSIPEPYTVKSNISFENRYGDTVSYSKGDEITGDKETMNYIREYKSGKNPRLYEAVFFGEMFYRYALENRDYVNFFEYYEYNYQREQQKIYEEWYKKMRYGKMAKKIIIK